MEGTKSRWQDWACFTLGLWLAVSPWSAGYAGHDAATANAVFVGVALALGAHFEAVREPLAAEWLNLAAGAWLVAAPFVLGFAGATLPAVTSITVGSFVAGLAASALSLDKALEKRFHRQ